ncbi:MAG TPA: efflux RND transporter periplasmic adaptor subunit [Luteolibacter sp.]|nr:efflux RND transporter periplasmic adaptor subunit [Luteolibacter sp.]
MKATLPLVIALFCMLAGCGGSEKTSVKAADAPAVAVKTQPAISEPHIATEEVVGTVRSKLRAAVEAKVSGRVLEYTAVPGEMVKTGDLLATLDAREVQARVDQAKAMLDQARRDFARQEKLIATNATTRREFDSAQARVEVGEAAVNEAETMMSYARVTAPFDGVITRKLADVGDLAMPGKPLLEIEAPTNLRFEADLPEALLGNVKLGDKMKVMIASAGGPLEALVSEIAPVADAVSRTFQVKLDLPPAAGLRTGQFGRVSVPVAEVMLLLVPQSAVIKRGQMEMVFVVGDGKAALRLVKTGKTLDGQVEVLSGLEEGQVVVTEDPAQLSDGQPVTIPP